MKKSIYYVASVILVLLFSVVLAEIILQTIPVVYRNLPDKTGGKQYVYILGESSAAGEPYQDKIDFYKIFAYITGNKIDEKKIEFIRIASGGERLYVQFWKYFIYKYTHPFRKGIVFLYGGKNDWDNGENQNSFSKFLHYNVFYIFKDVFFKNKNFTYDYERLLLFAKKFGDDIFVSTISGNYAGFMPELSYNNKKFSKDFNEIDSDILTGKYEKALNNLTYLLSCNDDISKAWIFYRIGKIYEFTGKNKQANDNFIKAVDFTDDSRPTLYQNKVIKYLADKYNAGVADIYDKLYNSGEVIGFNFYIDNQHPNLKTYIMTARLFADAVSKKHKIRIERNNITEEEVLKYFSFEKNDMYKAYRHSLDVTLVHSKENDNANIYVFDKVEEYLKQIGLLNPYDEKRKEIIMNFYTMMFEALKGNKEKVAEIFKSSNLINQDKGLIDARPCDTEEYNKWVSNYLGINNFFDLSKGESK